MQQHDHRSLGTTCLAVEDLLPIDVGGSVLDYCNGGRGSNGLACSYASQQGDKRSEKVGG